MLMQLVKIDKSTCDTYENWREELREDVLCVGCAKKQVAIRRKKARVMRNPKHNHDIQGSY